MTIKDFSKELKTIYAKYFTNSKICVCKNCLGTTYTIKMYLVNNIDESHNNILMNDLFNISFYLTNNSNDFSNEEIENLPNTLLLECWHKSYHTKPTNKYCCYGTRLLSFRKTQGNAQKILTALDKFIARLHKSLIDDLDNDNITADFVDLLQQKLIR